MPPKEAFTPGEKKHHYQGKTVMSVFPYIEEQI